MLMVCVCRFYFTFGCLSPNSQQLEALFNHHRTTGLHHLPETHLEDLQDSPSLQEQLDALGCIDHHTSNIVRADGAGLLGKKACSYYPGCYITCSKISSKVVPHFFRTRLLHYLVKDDVNQMIGLLTERRPSPVPEEPLPNDNQPTTEAERAPPMGRNRRMTVGELQEALGVEVAPVTNLASQLTQFSSFRTSMIEQGCLYWVCHNLDADIFILNDYSSTTSLFQVTDFNLVTVVNRQVVQCDCDIFRTLTAAWMRGSCMHCRFIEEEVVPLMETVQQQDFQPTTGIGIKLFKAWQEKNAGCIRIGPATGKVLKFCVTGRDHSISFVHLSIDRQYVCCMSGECAVRMGAKKKLQSLSSAAVLCPHLDMFRAQEEMWRPFQEEGFVDGEDDGEGVAPAVDINIEDRNQVQV